MKRSIFYWSAAVICLSLFNAPASLASTTETAVTQVATPVAVNNEINSSQDFRVIDEYIDRGKLSDGRLIERHYLNPRALYVDKSGVERIRPEGWHKFYDDTRSRLTKKKESGYSFSLPVSESSSVEILSGDVQVIRNGNVVKSFAPKEPGFIQHREDLEDTSRVVTQYTGVYENIDVNFIDKRQRRTKEIIIK